jgi:hypothetical protein
MPIEYFDTGAGTQMVRRSKSGEIKRIEWRVANLLHRKNSPAVAEWDRNGLCKLQWWIHGVFYGKKVRYRRRDADKKTITHKRNGNTTITTIVKGDKTRTECRVNNRLHAEDGRPAVRVETSEGVKKVEFWHHGQPAQGVAEIIYGTYYYGNDIVYKKTISGARVVTKRGTYFNYKKTVYENSVLHCTTGPAKIEGCHSRRFPSYYLNGKELKEDEWRERVLAELTAVLNILPQPIAEEIFFYHYVHRIFFSVQQS